MQDSWFSVVFFLFLPVLDYCYPLNSFCQCSTFLSTGACTQFNHAALVFSIEIPMTNSWAEVEGGVSVWRPFSRRGYVSVCLFWRWGAELFPFFEMGRRFIITSFFIWGGGGDVLNLRLNFK